MRAANPRRGTGRRLTPTTVSVPLLSFSLAWGRSRTDRRQDYNSASLAILRGSQPTKEGKRKRKGKGKGKGCVTWSLFHRVAMMLITDFVGAGNTTSLTTTTAGRRALAFPGQEEEDCTANCWNSGHALALALAPLLV